MPFTLAETFFKVLIVVQKSFKHTLDHNFLSYLKSTDPCLLIARVFFSYRRPKHHKTFGHHLYNYHIHV